VRSSARRGSPSVRLATAGFAIVLQIASTSAHAEHVDLKPPDAAGWSPTAIFGFLHGPSYYGNRTLQVDTQPPGATLDLFYVRASFQKRYEQTTAPATVELPSRNEAGSRDSVTIRAFLPGYKLETVHVPVRSSQDKVLIELSPLPNALAGVAHTYFAGRAGLSLLMKQPATVRVQNAEGGFTVILGQTAEQPSARAVLDGIKSPFVEGVTSTQLGEDLLVQVQLAPGFTKDKLALRSLESEDSIRGLHRYTIDMAPRDQTAAGVERAREALGRIGTADVSGCAAVFDDALRNRLDREALARALSPRGDFTDPYVRSALRRLGEVSPGGAIQVQGGARYRSAVPLELSAAASEAASAKGFLALLREWTRLVEPEPFRAVALRSLVAPEMDPQAFAEALAAAEAAEHRCRGTAASSAVPDRS
jgi:hypothetical protein